jgi:hypothetical protein
MLEQVRMHKQTFKGCRPKKSYKLSNESEISSSKIFFVATVVVANQFNFLFSYMPTLRVQFSGQQTQNLERDKI